MSKDLAVLVRELQNTGEFDHIRLDPLAQFGTESNPFLGATLLPEVLKDSNAYTETQIRYQTVLANAGASYSPAQLNPGGRIVGQFDVKLGNTNQADQLTAQEYESVMKLLMQAGQNPNAEMQAIAALIRFYDKSIVTPMMTLNELYRWQAIIDAQVVRTGFNGYQETVNYPNPTGHRVNIPGGTVAAPTGWYSNGTTYDPYSDFFGAMQFLSTKGYRINRIISAFTPAYQFMRNPVVASRASGVSINSSGSFSQVRPQVSFETVNAELAANNLPRWEIYDRTYSAKDAASGVISSNNRFLERADYYPIVLLCTTGRDDVVDLGDRSTVSNVIQLQETLGYYAIGRVMGHANPGRVTYEMVEQKHPGGMYAEMIQEGLPVITEPEAIMILKVYKPTP